MQSKKISKYSLVHIWGLKVTKPSPVFLHIGFFPCLSEKTLPKELGQHGSTAGLHYNTVNSMRSDDATEATGTQTMSSMVKKFIFSAPDACSGPKHTVYLSLCAYQELPDRSKNQQPTDVFLVLQLFKEEHWAGVRGYGEYQGGDEDAGALRGAKRN